jgi:Sulfotransferase domain
MAARSPDRDVSRLIAKAAPGVVRRPVKRAVRRFGVATSEFRSLPDLLVIGTHRGGTTSLQRYLDQHPCVLRNFPRAQDVKGVRYFDENFFRGVEWYRSHFPTTAYRRYAGRLHGGPVLSGDASPYYLFHPAAAGRASKVVPEARIIVLLRDPIERAYSHWKRERRDGREPLEFEDAVAAEPDRLRGEVERILGDDRYYSYAHENFSYISQGLYLEPLRRWLDHYPRERVFIASSERFREDPQRVYDEVLEFLGLPAFRLLDAVPLNTTATGQDLEPELRRALMAHVAPHNRRLEAYLGLELGWSR